MNTANYFLVSKLDSKYATILTECEKRHKVMAPGCNLSVVEFVDGTALIKVKGGDDTWLNGQSFKSSPLAKYDGTKDSERETMYYSKPQAIGDVVGEVIE